MAEWTFSNDKKTGIVSPKFFNHGLSYGMIFHTEGINAGFIITEGDAKQNIIDVLRITANSLMDGKSMAVASKATQRLDKQRREEK